MPVELAARARRGGHLRTPPSLASSARRHSLFAPGVVDRHQVERHQDVRGDQAAEEEADRRAEVEGDEADRRASVRSVAASAPRPPASGMAAGTDDARVGEAVVVAVAVTTWLTVASARTNVRHDRAESATIRTGCSTGIARRWSS
jgi:hypothetical protein